MSLFSAYRLRLLAFGTVVALLCAAIFGIYTHHTPGPCSTYTEITIPKGAGLKEISQGLAQHHLLAYPRFFYWTVRLLGHHTRLRAGRFVIPPHVTPSTLLAELSYGVGEMVSLTIPEGWTTYQVVAFLKQHPDLPSDRVCLPEEGVLLPETYHVAAGTPVSVVLTQMQQDAAEALEMVWSKRPLDFPLKTPRELLILASIVEKETAHPDEKRRIAGVFFNRLQRNMPLQADPTVVYALTKGEGALGRLLTKADLKVPDLHNTYRHKGLPPSPIANVGIETLDAVLQHEKNPYVYFVADKSGRHLFSKTLKDHQRHIKKIYHTNKKTAPKTGAVSKKVKTLIA